ncbi:MAG: hypothetical protein WC197_03660 [Candidatus Gastranaerophilaceae bacterium]|jgi:hypothetical protein
MNNYPVSFGSNYKEYQVLSKTPDLEIIRKIYNSEKPFKPVGVAFLDTFGNDVEDINNDGYPDMPHGKFVENVARTCLNFNPIIYEYRVRKNNKNEVPDETMLKAFNAIDNNPDVLAVNVSQADAHEISILESKYNILASEKSEKTTPARVNITPQNIKGRKAQVMEVFMKTGHELLNQIIKKIEHIAKSKAVFIAAGNNSSEGLNAYNLADGTFNVGSMKIKGKSDFSCDNEAVNLFALGEYGIAPVREKGNVTGFNITENGTIDIPLSDIKGYEIIQKFVGKDIEKVKASNSERQKLLELKQRYYSGEKIIESDIGNLKDKLYYSKINNRYIDFDTAFYLQENQQLKEQGLPTKTPRFSFNVNEDGKIVYDLNDKKLLGSTGGTSYAAPTAMAMYLNSLNP